MRKAFDGSDINQFQQLGPRQQGFPPRPQSAKVLMYNNNLNPNNYGNEYIDDPSNYSKNQINVRDNSGAPSARGYQPQRQQNGGMKRQSSAHRNFENNALEANKNGLQIGKINQNVNVSFSDVQKHMPKIFSQDKEKLYADNLTLKATVNNLTEENLKNKTKLSQSERELGKLKKMIEQYEGNAVVKGQYLRQEGNSHITENLKKNVKDLRNDLQARDEEIAQMKKQLKYTRVQELDIERKSFMEECQRLKQLLQQACNEKMQELIKETDFQKLEERTHLALKESQDIRALNRDLQMEIQAMQNLNSSLSQKSNEMLKKCQDQIFKLKKSNKEKDRELTELKNTLARLRGQPIARGAVSGIRPSSAKVGGKLFGEDLLQQKDQMIAALQQEVSRLKSQEKLKTDNTNELNNNRDDIESLNNRDLTMTNDRLKQQLVNSNNNQELMENQEKLLESYGKGEIMTDILVTRVRREDILRIGEELQYKLRAQSLSENEAAQQLFDNLETSSSIRSLHGLFQEVPFSLEPSKSLLFARYLIEEQTGQYGFSWDAERQNQAVFESFRDAVGIYKVFSTAYAKKLYDSLVEVFSKNRVGIKAALESREKQDGSVTKEDFLESFELLGTQLQKDQIAFCIMTMILHSPGIDKLHYRELLKLFKGQHEEGVNDDEDEEYENENEYGYDQYLIQQQMNYPAENGHEGINEEDGEYYEDEDDEEIMEDNYVGENTEKNQGQGGKNNFEVSEEQNKVSLAPEEYDRLLKQKEQELISSWKDESDEEADKKGGKNNLQQQKIKLQKQQQEQQYQQQQRQQLVNQQKKEQQNQKKQSSSQQDQKKNQQLAIEEHWEEEPRNRISKQGQPDVKREEEIMEVLDEEYQPQQQQKAKVEASNYEEEFDIVSDDEQ